MKTGFYSIVVLGLGLLIGACERPGGAGVEARSWEEIRSSGELRVVTRNAPTTYYIDRDGHPAGPDYQLLAAFAESQQLTLRVTPVDALGEVFSTLDSGAADIAAAGLTITDSRKESYRFSKPVESVVEKLVCRRNGKTAKSVGQLAGVSLEVAAGSSYEESLRALQEQHPDLRWKSNAELGTEQLLQKVWAKKVDCTIADSNIVSVNRRFMPELLVMLDISDKKSLAWAMPKASTELQAAIDKWIGSDSGALALQVIHDRYYSFIDSFDFVDTRALIERISERLPKFEKLFDKAASQHHIDTSLLAAQAYQESHWDAKAKSPSGVRGIMMLTQNTAQSLGVKDRLDPAQAIPAGAEYLAKMRERFDEDIPEPDRTFMALAAYNIGRAHMHDAQTLARKLGKDPKSWSDLREVLPLLSDKRYYKNLKYGYARGVEPVRYVQRIRNYEDIIKEKQ